MRIASVVCFWLSAIAAHAAAPSLAQRVLVVYNPGLADSAAVANYYAVRRGIPAANLCAISPPSQITVTQSAFETTVKQPVQACLNAAGRTYISSCPT
jgi:uncharacterized protein (TIGR03790 family)